MCFSATQPPKIHFSMKGNEVYSPEKIDIPGDPGKTKPVKCIKPPPQNKRSWGGWISRPMDPTFDVHPPVK